MQRTTRPFSCTSLPLAISRSFCQRREERGGSLFLVHALDDLARLVVGWRALEVAGGRLLVVERERDTEQVALLRRRVDALLRPLRHVAKPPPVLRLPVRRHRLKRVAVAVL